jgi:hypothetical protein
LSFNSLVTEVSEIIIMTIFQRTPRKSQQTKTDFKVEIEVFLTLFWMAYYPTLLLMSSLFDIHSQSLSQILKRTVNVMVKKLKPKLTWPSKNEMNTLTSTYFQNEGFTNAVCVVDEVK